ncbi:hypothetical protein QYM36_002831 [Artemia franciscana]|uniref:Integrase catalytic domain-containing protein n=1 Tax=Artemia franciscana TaxID=6661 RepID=A0AA88I9G1_ARTSF|nr:hypothetical protein QYM36_002831 [Artemia franciscana]
MMQQIQPYYLSFVYRPGTEIAVTDTLSRLHNPDVNKKLHREIEVYVHQVTQSLPLLSKTAPPANKFSHNNQKEPHINSQIPLLPWQRVASDIFDWNEGKYIITVNYQSHYLKVDKLRNLKSKEIFCKLKAHFTQHGIPSTIMSDNGTQYSLSKFKQFVENWGTSHKTSGPICPQCNGLVEKAMQTCKNIFSKATESGDEPYPSLLEYRKTSVGSYATPAQLLMSH